MESFTEAWNLICDFCKNRITEVAFTTWISRIEPVTLDFNQGTAILKVPNDFHRQTLERCYTSLLTEALDEVLYGSDERLKIRGQLVGTSSDYFVTFALAGIGHGQAYGCPLLGRDGLRFDFHICVFKCSIA